MRDAPHSRPVVELNGRASYSHHIGLIACEEPGSVMEKDDQRVIYLNAEETAELLDRIEAVDARVAALSSEEQMARRAERRARGQQALAQIRLMPSKKPAAV